jgi:hypothetical protein
MAFLGVGQSLFSASFEVLTDTRESYVGQSITLIMRIISDGPVDRPSLPNIEGFQVNEAGESRYDQRTLGGGNSGRTVTMEYSWRLVPLQTGEFEIPALTLELGDDSYRSKAIPIRIKEPGPIEGYHLFLSAEGDTAFPSMPLRLHLKWLFSSEVSRPDFVLPFLNNEKIKVQDLPAPSSSSSDIYQFTVEGHTVYARQSAEMYEGEQYASLTISWDIYPLESGTLELKPVTLSFQIGSIDQQGRRVYTPAVIPSNALLLYIQTLPEKMNTFAGGVLVAQDELEVTAELDQTKVYPGDPLELTLTFKGLISPLLTDFKGIGRMKELGKLISADQSSLSSSLEGNDKVYTQKIRIQSSDLKAFPKLEFPYYSMDSKEVRISSSNEIPMNVMSLASSPAVIQEAESPKIEEKTGISLRSNRLVSYPRFSLLPARLYALRYRILIVLLTLTVLVTLFFLLLKRYGRHLKFVHRNASLKVLRGAFSEYKKNPNLENGLALSERFRQWLGEQPEVKEILQNQNIHLMEALETLLSRDLYRNIQALNDHLELHWSPTEMSSLEDDFEQLPEKITKELKNNRRKK